MVSGMATNCNAVELQRNTFQLLQGVNRTSIVVMDNCSIHHVAEVRSILEDAGMLIIYLLPDIPDLNSIEEAFGYVKGYLKKHDDIAAAFS